MTSGMGSFCTLSNLSQILDITSVCRCPSPRHIGLVDSVSATLLCSPILWVTLSETNCGYVNLRGPRASQRAIGHCATVVFHVFDCHNVVVGGAYDDCFSLIEHHSQADTFSEIKTWMSKELELVTFSLRQGRFCGLRSSWQLMTH